MNKEKILNLLKEIENQLNIKEKIELEEKNFKINSDNWVKKTNENWVEYLENETADVWQLLSNGEQLFTRNAAMRETQKAGKRMPTDEEFEELNKEDFDRIMYTGYCDPYDSFYELGTNAVFWSSTENNVTKASIRDLSSSLSTVDRHEASKDHRFSVRCIQE